MTAPKTFKRYAPIWFELFDTFKNEPNRVVTITLESPNQAKGMRGEFYKARDAFCADPDLREEYEEALNSREVKVRGNDCIFDHKDKNWVVGFIEKALAKE